MTRCHGYSLAAYRTLRLCLFCGSLMLSGCLVIPVDQATVGSRDKISEDTIAAFQVGVTTRKDVVLRLGEPDYVTEDERQLQYFWSRIYMIWAVVGQTGNGAVGDVGKKYTLLVTFSPEGLLQQTELVKAPIGDADSF